MTQGNAPSVVIYSAPFFPKIGGMEEFSRNLALGLHDLGCAVEVVTDTPSEARGPFPFPVHRTSSLEEKTARFEKADVVIFTGVRLREALKALRLRKRVILTHHGTYIDPRQPRTWLLGLAKRLLSRLFTNVSVSHYIARKIGGQQTVIHNSFDNVTFARAETVDRPRASFVFCGRLVSQKGCMVAIDALAEMQFSHPDATLTVIGNGPELDNLISYARFMGLEETVTFTGALSPNDVAATLKAHRCAVIPSRAAEGFGIVALEALASGCEVIATPKGGLPEALGGQGWLVRPTPKAFRAAMTEVAGGESRRSQPADWLAAHTRDAISRDYLQEIERLIA